MGFDDPPRTLIEAKMAAYCVTGGAHEDVATVILDEYEELEQMMYPAGPHATRPSLVKFIRDESGAVTWVRERAQRAEGGALASRNYWTRPPALESVARSRAASAALSTSTANAVAASEAKRRVNASSLLRSLFGDSVSQRPSAS